MKHYKYEGLVVKDIKLICMASKMIKMGTYDVGSGPCLVSSLATYLRHILCPSTNPISLLPRYLVTTTGIPSRTQVILGTRHGTVQTKHKHTDTDR